MPFSQYEVEGQFKDNVGRGEEKIVRRYRMERVRQNGEIGGERQKEKKKEGETLCLAKVLTHCPNKYRQASVQ